MTAVLDTPTPLTYPGAVTVDALDLARALRTVKPLLAPSRYRGLPTLAAVRLTASAGLLALDTWDYEHHLHASVRASRSHPDPDTWLDVAVDHGRLLTALKGTRRGVPVTITPVGAAFTPASVSVAVGATTVLMPVVDVSEMSAPPALVEPALFTVPGDVLARAAEFLCPAASTDETLPVLHQVALDPRGGTWTALATNRYVAVRFDLGVQAVPLDRARTEPLLIPSKALARAVKHLDPHRLVLVSADQQYVSLAQPHVGGTHVTVLQHVGSYPRIGSLFHDSTANTMTVDREQLAHAVSAVGAQVTRGRPLRLTLDGCELTVSGLVGEDEQDASQPVYVDDHAGEWGSAYNPTFLSNALSGKGPAQVTLRALLPATKPVVITHSDTPGLHVLLMPVRQAA